MEQELQFTITDMPEPIFTITQVEIEQMETKQTALDFLLTELDIPKLINREKLTIAAEIVRQAKEMHKQEIENAYSDGAKGGANGGKGQHKDGWVSIQMKEKYYNETFGK